ncbi:MAG: hypothetical protein L6Q77_13255 [Bacteroidetes bacterium]|nr:hypothetical protein [Bacteroidota bacterium]
MFIEVTHQPIPVIFLFSPSVSNLVKSTEIELLLLVNDKLLRPIDDNVLVWPLASVLKNKLIRNKKKIILNRKIVI